MRELREAVAHSALALGSALISSSAAGRCEESKQRDEREERPRKVLQPLGCPSSVHALQQYHQESGPYLTTQRPPWRRDHDRRGLARHRRRPRPFRRCAPGRGRVRQRS